MSLNPEEKAKLIQLLNRCAKMIILDTSDGSVWSITNMNSKKFDFSKLEEFLRMENFEDCDIDWAALNEEFHGRRVNTEITRSGKADIIIGRNGNKIYFIHINLKRNQTW